MKRRILKKYPRSGLKKRRGVPMKGIKFMHISSQATSIPFTFNRVTSQSYSFVHETDDAAASDSAVLNIDPSQFTSLVDAAKSTPEVRSDLVDSFKARISSGEYPSAGVVSGLTDVLSGVLAQRASQD